MDRRRFLKLAASTSLATVATQPWLGAAAHASAGWHKTLVLVELAGGNDGLNTIVPFAQPTYQKLRPQLALGRQDTIELADGYGLHKALGDLMYAWDGGELAIVRGVGLLQTPCDHVRAAHIADTDNPNPTSDTPGWLTAAFSQTDVSALATTAALLGGADPGPATAGNWLQALDPENFKDNARQLRSQPNNLALAHLLGLDPLPKAQSLHDALAAAPQCRTRFPKSHLGAQMAMAARMIAAGMAVPVIRLVHHGYDTHLRQRQRHSALLADLGASLSALRSELLRANRWKDTLVMTTTEFGRSAAQNKTQGTEHGTGCDAILVGGLVNGGFHGQPMDLDALTQEGHLKPTTDPRALHATITQALWNVSTNFKDTLPGLL